MLTREEVAELVSREMAGIRDPQVQQELRQLLVPPYVVVRAWDYGEPGQTFDCWTVAEHRESDTAIAYCDQGFGPAYPWGLVGIRKHTGIGMDCGWFRTLEEAFRDSYAWQGDNPQGYETS